jgi:Tn3 transposase DDE domain
MLNAIVLYNTSFTRRALDHLKATGVEIAGGDVERLSPLGTGQITLTGRYASRYSSACRTRLPTDHSPRHPPKPPDHDGPGDKCAYRAFARTLDRPQLQGGCAETRVVGSTS